MIIDSSAIQAVIGREPGYERIVHELATSPVTRIGAPTRLEAGIVLAEHDARILSRPRWTDDQI
jgi:ribonuclease VapC